jgi:3'-phosphoadenosine 5'-phosphosulfate sulfotransferase (PAPS reductase)/FAD synthetase
MNIINFSGGRTSAYMTKKLIEGGLTDYLIVFQNTGKETEETLEFINQCSIEWKVKIHWIEYDTIELDGKVKGTFTEVSFETASRRGEPFEKAIQKNNGYLPSSMQRYCTKFLKLKTLKYFLKSMGIRYYTNYIGIRYDEQDRVAKIRGSLRPKKEDLELPLYKWKITKQDILDWWKEQPFDLKTQTLYGNCDGCFLKGKGKLLQIAREKPELLNWWAEMEESTGKQFRKEISYRQILEKAKSQPDLWADDPGFNCFCNID